MSRFKQKGFVEYMRGHIRLLDVPALEAETCECYHVLKYPLNNYLDFGTRFAI